MEIQTENAFQKLDVQVFYGCNVPKQCKLGTFSIYVAYNIDLNDEIFFGMNKSNLFLTLVTRSKSFLELTTP